MKKYFAVICIALILDSIVNALPVVVTVWKNVDYASMPGRHPSRVAIGSFIYFSVLYLVSLTPTYLILSILYYLIVQSFEYRRQTLMLIGVTMSTSAYLIYAKMFSVEFSFSYFYWRIAWYSFLGLLVGWLCSRFLGKNDAHVES